MTPGASEAAALATDTARFIYEHIAVARAAGSLEKALAEVQPAVQRIAQVISDDVKDLDALLRVATQAQKNALEDSSSAKPVTGPTYSVPPEPLRDAPTEASRRQNPSSLAEAPELRAINGLLAAARRLANHSTLSWRPATIESSSAVACSPKSTLGSQAGRPHTARILSAVRSRRTPNAVELTLAAQRIQELVERYEAL